MLQIEAKPAAVEVPVLQSITAREWMYRIHEPSLAYSDNVKHLHYRQTDTVHLLDVTSDVQWTGDLGQS